MSQQLPGTEPASPDPTPEPVAPAEAAGADAAPTAEPGGGGEPEAAGVGAANGAARKRRRRGSRGGRGRAKARPRAGTDDGDDEEDADDLADDLAAAEVDGGAGHAASTDEAPPPAKRTTTRTRTRAADGRNPEELPDRMIEGRVQSTEVAEQVLVRRPRIGDSRPAPEATVAPAPAPAPAAPKPARAKSTTRGGGRQAGDGGGQGGGDRRKRKVAQPAAEVVDERPKGRERKGKPVGRYQMCVHIRPGLTQIAVLEGRALIEHYAARPQDDVAQIHGNIYVGRVQNVLPGMEAAFVDIGTPKNAVLYRGDVQYDAEDIVEKGERPRIEQMLKARQLILCQVTKNPIGAKGARLTQEVSLPGRFVVLIPNSKTYGISKRLSDDERKRLRSILDKVKPAEHGVIVRTAAEGVDEDELRRDVKRLLDEWATIEARWKKASSPALLYREPDMAVRVIREELNADYRGIVIDDPALYEDVRAYVEQISPGLADRVQFYDTAAEGLPLFERHHVHEQLHKALDRKVWLPSGGSLIIEHTEALTVIDVNTGKNVGSTNLEETVFRNNLEAAEEIARQLRLRDVGGIIVIDFIDMEIKENRSRVVNAFREALARDKTRTQVFEISDLGLVEMTRKRIGEGLLTAFADPCPHCEGRGVVVDHSLYG